MYFPRKGSVIWKATSCHEVSWRSGCALSESYHCRTLIKRISVDVISHDDVIKWKHFPRYWPFVRGIHRTTVNSSHKGQRRGALLFSLICTCLNAWINNCRAGDLRGHRTHYDVTVMISGATSSNELQLLWKDDGRMKPSLHWKLYIFSHGCYSRIEWCWHMFLST